MLFRSSSRRSRSSRRTLHGGSLTLNYPSGYSQYQNNNGSLSNTYFIGSSLSAGQSALANPPPFQKLGPNGIDNYVRASSNSYGNSAGSGFPSRGWF